MPPLTFAAAQAVVVLLEELSNPSLVGRGALEVYGKDFFFQGFTNSLISTAFIVGQEKNSLPTTSDGDVVSFQKVLGDLPGVSGQGRVQAPTELSSDTSLNLLTEEEAIVFDKPRHQFVMCKKVLFRNSVREEDANIA